MRALRSNHVLIPKVIFYIQIKTKSLNNEIPSSGYFWFIIFTQPSFR